MMQRAAVCDATGRMHCEGLCADAEFQECGVEDREAHRGQARLAVCRCNATAASLHIHGSSGMLCAEPIQTQASCTMTKDCPVP
jgi:hypothetical protein